MAPSKKRVGRAILAMNVLGDEWVLDLAKHPPEPGRWPSMALEAFQNFSAWLWARIVLTHTENAWGGINTDERERETFRRTFPAFELFQAWWNRELHLGGIEARAEAMRLELREAEVARKFEETTGLKVEHPEGIHYATGEARKWIEGEK